MFVVLKTVDPDKKFIQRRKQKKRLDCAQIKSCPTNKGLPFYTLEVLSGKQGIDWNSVAEKCGRYASRIIVSRKLPLPDHPKLRRFVPIFMNSLLVFNTAVKTIKAAELTPEKLSVTVTDRNAVHPSRILRLLPLASTVRIVTTQPERYAAACSEAFDEYGASLIIRSSYEATAKPDIVICCDGIISSTMDSAAIFSAKRRIGGAIRFFGSGTELLPHHAEVLPVDVDAVDFTGALTELCGSSEYKNAVFSHIDINCSFCGNSTPEQCLKCYCSGNGPYSRNT